MTKDPQCLFFYGMLLDNPRWTEGYIPPYADRKAKKIEIGGRKKLDAKRDGALDGPLQAQLADVFGVYLSFAQEFIDTGEVSLKTMYGALDEEDPFEVLDYYWERRGDPVCIGRVYEYWEPRNLVYLAIRETLHQDRTFDPPDEFDRAAWDRLLRAKCEAHHFIYEAFPPPRFFIMFLHWAI